MVLNVLKQSKLVTTPRTLISSEGSGERIAHAPERADVAWLALCKILCVNSEAQRVQIYEPSPLLLVAALLDSGSPEGKGLNLLNQTGGLWLRALTIERHSREVRKSYPFERKGQWKPSSDRKSNELKRQ
jgi:hypothetical protein